MFHGSLVEFIKKVKPREIKPFTHDEALQSESLDRRARELQESINASRDAEQELLARRNTQHIK